MSWSVIFHAEVMIEKTGDVVYPITAGITGKQLYTASVSVVGSDGVVDALNLNFSELVDFDKGFINDTINSCCC